MQPLPDDPAHLPPPWWTPHAGMPEVERELQRELTPGHPLHGATVAAVARCGACDDVLFQVEGRPFAWALVHLTWTRREEHAPWPMTTPLSGPAELSTAAADHGCSP
ncbi:hypothetical protein GTW43_34695 [Streptomyces sp. SID5785]|uniref:hypothetical protein n=1 Tax=Streptomyces sp. SID5785 TaxID=2690309 RepID=UPI001361E4B9|nr:hypothetical protein [Streptomyces sp. SID5785]MZD10191.1 hypothetical protein [Streptomyces sp. SID5785]